jgi:hypothetical protein
MVAHENQEKKGKKLETSEWAAAFRIQVPSATLIHARLRKELALG